MMAGRRRFCYFIGFLVGIASFLSVYLPPEASAILTSPAFLPFRMLRIAVPLLILLVPILFRDPRRKFHRHFRDRAAWRTGLMLTALGALPFLVALSTADSKFALGVGGPFLIAIAFLVGSLALTDEEAFAVGVGVGVVPLVLILRSLAMTGLASSGFYGRPRVLLGFVHPAVTASALVAATFAVLSLARLHLPPSRFRVAAVAIVVLSLALLSLASSRNVLVAVLLFLVGWPLSLRLTPRTRGLVFLVALNVPLFLIAYSATLSPNSLIYQATDSLTSGRLNILAHAIPAILNQDVYLNLWPQAPYRDAAVQDAGFAALDSVYVSYLANFGLGATLVFLTFLGGIGMRLSRRGGWPYALLLSVLAFFHFDSQGITTSNLVVYGALVVSIRVALSSAGESPRTLGQSPKPRMAT